MKKTVRAERPVTARIRERLGEVVVEEPEQVAETPTAEVIAVSVPVAEKTQEAKTPADGFNLISEVERRSNASQRVMGRRTSQGQMRLF